MKDFKNWWNEAEIFAGEGSMQAAEQAWDAATELMEKDVKKEIDRLNKENTELDNEIGELRELLAQTYIRLSGKRKHYSDCATSNAPAYTPGECDCDYEEKTETKEIFPGTLDDLGDLKIR